MLTPFLFKYTKLLKMNNNKFKSNLKLRQPVFLRILILLGLGIVLPLIIFYLLNNQVVNLSSPEIFQAESGTVSGVSLKFNMESLTIVPEDEFRVNILLNTAGETVTAVDALIYFDASLLEFLGAEKGTISELPYYPALGNVTQEDNLSVISISAIDFNPSTQTFTAGFQSSGTSSGLFSSLRFKAKAISSGQNVATTNLTFKVSSGSTADSNIFKKDGVQDILSQVNNLSLTLALPNPSPSPSPTPLPSPSPMPSPIPTALPPIPSPSTIIPTPLPPIPSPSGMVSTSSVEAEAGTRGGDMKIASDSRASGGKYIYPYRNSTASYRFKIVRDSDFYIWVRVNSTNHSNNSFYLYFDSRTTRHTLSPDVTNNQWEWYRARLAKGFLSKGTHTIKFSKLDPYAKLDKVIFTDDPNLRP